MEPIVIILSGGAIQSINFPEELRNSEVCVQVWDYDQEGVDEADLLKDRNGDLYDTITSFATYKWASFYKGDRPF